MHKIFSHLKDNWVRYGFETLVVTVGILGAFALNHWNDQRKRDNLEIETLKEIEISLNSNLVNIKNEVNDLRQDASNIKFLITHLQSGKPYADSLEKLFYYPYRKFTIVVNRSAFEILENRGIDIISNKELRSNIVDQYNLGFATMEKFGLSETIQLDDFRKYYITKVVPNLEDTFIGYTGRKYPKVIPNQYEELLNDITFINQLKWRITRIELIADRLETGFAESTLKLEKEISKELKRLD